MTTFQDLVAPLDSLVRSEDRCDRCGAEALVRVVIRTTQLPLLFCGHHYAKQEAALDGVAVVTHDERASLFLEPDDQVLEY